MAPQADNFTALLNNGYKVRPPAVGGAPRHSIAF